jgi:transposase
MTPAADPVPDDIDALRTALAAERAARHAAESRVSGAEAVIAHLKLVIAKYQRDRFGPTSETPSGCNATSSPSNMAWRT